MTHTNLNILFVASEAVPFAKTGGLADVIGALPAALSKRGHDLRVFLPYYRMVKKSGYKTTMVLPRLRAPISDHVAVSAVHMVKKDNVTFYFLEQDGYYDREHLYGTAQGDYPDNAERFIYFNRAVLEAVRHLGFHPHVIHCNDWQTGLIPVYLKSIYKNDPVFRNATSIFTVHNIAYQGDFWHWDIHLTGLGWEYFVPEWIECYGRINLLKSGILHSDAVNTVSARYAREIQTPEYAYGLDGVVRARQSCLWGIVNGIDYRVFDPVRDEAVPHKYSAGTLEKKALNKRALRKEFGLPGLRLPMVGMVSRLVDQKGFDLLSEAMERLLALKIQLVILGTGDEKYHKMLREMVACHPRHVGLKLAYDPKLAQLIYAGSDFFLMPSRYEPCGLGQLIALRYGAVPIVRYTGGLADTVCEFNVYTKEGTGFGFDEYRPDALLGAVERALSIYNKGDLWEEVRRNAMAAEWSWESSAEKYEKMYHRAYHKCRGWHVPKD